VDTEVIEQNIMPVREDEGGRRVWDCPTPMGVKIARIIQFDASPVGHMRSVWTLTVVQSLCS